MYAPCLCTVPFCCVITVHIYNPVRLWFNHQVPHFALEIHQIDAFSFKITLFSITTVSQNPVGNPALTTFTFPGWGHTKYIFCFSHMSEIWFYFRTVCRQNKSNMSHFHMWVQFRSICGHTPIMRMIGLKILWVFPNGNVGITTIVMRGGLH